MKKEHGSIIIDLPGIIHKEDYRSKRFEEIPIEGLKIKELEKFFATEDGSFWELCRIGEDGTLEGELGVIAPGFKIRQVNRSETVPGQIKAWHIHDLQDEIWLIPSNARVVVGIMDMRKNSLTLGNVQRHCLRGNQGAIALYLPRGVAHGYCSPEKFEIFYLVNRQFDGTDEKRMKYYYQVRENFWKPPYG